MKEKEIVDKLIKKALPIPGLFEAMDEPEQPTYAVTFSFDGEIVIFTEGKPEGKEILAEVAQEAKETLEELEEFATNKMNTQVAFDNVKVKSVDHEDEFFEK